MSRPVWCFENTFFARKAWGEDAVDVVYRSFRAGGYPVRKGTAHPDAQGEEMSRWRDFTDRDLYVTPTLPEHRSAVMRIYEQPEAIVEVKRRDFNWSSAENFPFTSVMIVPARKHAEYQPKPLVYVLVSENLLHACIVPSFSVSLSAPDGWWLEAHLDHAAHAENNNVRPVQFWMCQLGCCWWVPSDYVWTRFCPAMDELDNFYRQNYKAPAV